MFSMIFCLYFHLQFHILSSTILAPCWGNVTVYVGCAFLFDSACVYVCVHKCVYVWVWCGVWCGVFVFACMYVHDYICIYMCISILKIHYCYIIFYKIIIKIYKHEYTIDKSLTNHFPECTCTNIFQLMSSFIYNHFFTHFIYLFLKQIIKQ